MYDRPRFTNILNLEQFRKQNGPTLVSGCRVSPPASAQYVLRMLVRAPHHDYWLPDEMCWLSPLLVAARAHQETVVGVRHPYCYVTVRHGDINFSHNDTEWHLDGFSMRYHHLPEANYLWLRSKHPTQFRLQGVDVPEDFDPLRHNIHKLLARRCEGGQTFSLRSQKLFMIDPYVLHRRPPESSGEWRTFVRISFTPIEINDRNNTPNPRIPTPHYVLDGRAHYESLADYDAQASADS